MTRVATYDCHHSLRSVAAMDSCFALIGADGCAMLMSPKKGETAVHGCHCPGDMAVRMSKVLTRPWVGVRVPLALSLSHYFVLP